MKHVHQELYKQLTAYNEILNFRNEFIEQSAVFLTELLEYNQKVNLISRRDEESVVENQWLHSILPIIYVGWDSVDVVLDIGSGGGFPGVLLALYFPDISFWLVESITKKAKFLSDVAGQLSLTNVVIKNCRVETIVKSDFSRVTARAVTDLSTLWKWSKPLLKPLGELITWKGNYFLELQNLKKGKLNYSAINIVRPELRLVSQRISSTSLIILTK